ncbi:hypothetical protein CC80DRAFT_479881 [Byssothecium circinans]|uniref:Uncharacterized protein n=1 Tax=Byssothecium circinans TaxID=147558 RepID=A0A6A5TN58_9PLEO|nr:hypothetical protein CC80DRAFT_479881 [Byssothecium circinans]
MPPKESKTGSVEQAITGFEPRETKLLAAAFYDYELFARLTGNTAGSLKKMFPPIKRKATEAHPSFAAYLGATASAGESKVPATKKRKVASEVGEDAGADADTDTKEPDAEPEEKEKEPKKKKKAPAKGRGRPKKAKSDKSEDVKEEPAPDDDAHGGE